MRKPIEKKLPTTVKDSSTWNNGFSEPSCVICHRLIVVNDDHQDVGAQEPNGTWTHYRCAA